MSRYLYLVEIYNVLSVDIFSCFNLLILTPVVSHRGRQRLSIATLHDHDTYLVTIKRYHSLIWKKYEKNQIQITNLTSKICHICTWSQPRCSKWYSDLFRIQPLLLVSFLRVIYVIRCLNELIVVTIYVALKALKTLLLFINYIKRAQFS